VPANYKVPPHTHPVDEIVTGISGEFNIGMGREFNEAQLKPYTAGGLIAMPAHRTRLMQAFASLLVLAGSLLPEASRAQLETEVDLALVLAVDVSRSMEDDEQKWIGGFSRCQA
jgi:quercetin dioxygenase-like cupin family protein